MNKEAGVLDGIPHQGLEKHRFTKDITLRIFELQQKNNWYNFFAIGLDWLIISSVITLHQYITNIWVYLLAILIIGSRMRGLDIMMHEASHRMLFKNQKLNKWVASIFAAYPIFISYKAYCSSHMNHHRFLWSEIDPDKQRYKIVGLDNPSKNKISFFISHCVKPVFLVHVPNYLIGMIKVTAYSKGEPLIDQIVRISFWCVILASSIYFGFWQELILYWFVPFITTFQILKYWAEMAEHAGLESDKEIFASRNSFGNWLERLLLHPHRNSYHLVHHLFPAVPHYNIKKAHMILLEDPDYRNAHHCTGFFLSFAPGFSSVIDDIQGHIPFWNKLKDKQ
ncbi:MULTISPECIES: fatty acid desaturase family protein [unclassified Cytobacillus]|uniref:fatty acid desaturase family protein n=1 Tax=unclassified Cytobacillus TaxID=2675268 RepID=UPI0013F976BD|nr:fatty acid desaturase family protein [Cytobacillus sp. AMY 15.2]KAF0818526.1 Fatty acid desaturase [Bacillus sp. ZZV12-4809]MCM3092573.1 fatty acid desaturase family protein [Cytobacillus sp. AMY 15.2]